MTQIDAALAELRGTMAERFATANGSLALVAQRQDQTDQRLSDHETRLAALERGETERQKRDTTRLDAIERTRWPLPSVAALVALLGLALSVWQFATR
ncbi:hypothetical protein ACQF36_41635 [Streptomyces sp. Marseille-Q5077]|uniref:hypothetical protein n=1 Tax=Streptomyces sp. Marseille-Q5077 TaxID=3418995 RepID=UPI003D0439D6